MDTLEALHPETIACSHLQETAPRFVEKPWGHEIWWAVTDRYAGKVLAVRAGHKLSLQFHHHKDETNLLMSGELLLHSGPSVDAIEVRRLAPGATWRNTPGWVHTIEAVTDAQVIEVSTPELDDVVRLSDDYGREGT